jgi:hypothetical protein
MATIGTDCDITLQHAEVNGGEPVGFLLALPENQKLKPYGPAINLQYETLQSSLGDPETVFHVYVNILLADHLQNPDGSTHTETAFQMRGWLMDLVSKHSEIYLTTRFGVYANLKTLSETINTLIGYQVYPMMEYNQYAEIETARVHLTTRSGSFGAIDPIIYSNSFWVDEATYTGERTWDNSYWR